MNHERIRELLALRVYGELEPDEEQVILEHLRACRRCSQFVRELESGLGRARALHSLGSEAGLPAGWESGLADATAGLRRRSWMRAALLVGAGLAAGVLAMLAWGALAKPPADSPAVASRAADAPAFLRFQGGTPPPLATGGGPGTRYLAWQAK